MLALQAGLLYFVAVFAVGFVLGVLRTFALVPWVGSTPAVMIELPVILGVAWWISARILRRMPLKPSRASIMGATAFALLMLGEFSLSMLLFGRDLGGHLALYRDASQLLGLAGQVVFALFPFVQSVRGRTSATN